MEGDQNVGGERSQFDGDEHEEEVARHRHQTHPESDHHQQDVEIDLAAIVHQTAN